VPELAAHHQCARACNGVGGQQLTVWTGLGACIRGTSEARMGAHMGDHKLSTTHQTCLKDLINAFAEFPQVPDTPSAIEGTMAKDRERRGREV